MNRKSLSIDEPDDAGHPRSCGGDELENTMANHERKRAKKQRAGCLLCKPHEMNGIRNGDDTQRRQERIARTNEREWRQAIAG